MNNRSHVGGYHVTEREADEQYDKSMSQWITSYRHLQAQGETLRDVQFTGILMMDGPRCSIAVQEWENRQDCADMKKLIQVVTDEPTLGELTNAAYMDEPYDLDGDDYMDYKRSINDGFGSALWFAGVEPVEF